MNISKVNLVNFIFIFLFLIGCKDQDVIYPPQPHVEFENIVYEEQQLPARSSLFITFSVTDGDLDVGLEMNQTDFPFHFAYFYLKKDGSRISSDKLERGEVGHNELIQVEDRLVAPFDTLPDPATSCKYFSHNYGESPDYKSVQLYADLNENYSNLFVKLLLKEQDGSFAEEDLSADCFYNRNGRIPPLNGLTVGKDYVTGPFKIALYSQQKGRITYEISSYFSAFKSRTLKAQLFVKDRALNISNIIETPEFSLWNKYLYSW